MFAAHFQNMVLNKAEGVFLDKSAGVSTNQERPETASRWRESYKIQAIKEANNGVMVQFDDRLGKHYWDMH